MLISALDPTFTLHSDFYYRSLLAKVERMTVSFFSVLILSDIRQGKAEDHGLRRQGEAQVRLACTGWLEFALSWLHGCHNK